ncbi:uncharacterized protein LOC111077037 [Drosophila obscura]|uniref:uncharacterized protein LOC111077037 n=1 Tax=Drosophila obscura TaxID=7282 RepID=UPI001BB1C96E|nr:uncharacterized protein LOC111077037 [Drosophila obscura]
MKAVIILVLVGSVLAVPPFRVMSQSQSVSQDAHAHIFAEVRPAGQKHQQQSVDMELNEQALVVKTKPAHQAAAENHAYEVELKPAHQSTNENHVVEVGIKQAEQKPQHIELDIKPVQHSPSHVVELEIKQADHHQKPQHIDVELVADHQGVQTHHEVELEVIRQQQPPHQIEVEIVKAGDSNVVKQTLPVQSLQHLNLNLAQ